MNSPLLLVNKLLQNSPLIPTRWKINQPYLNNNDLEKSLEINKLYYRKNLPILRDNVLIIILESFGSELIGYYNGGVGHTPFVDSLCKHSFVFKNSFANARHSNEGIPAILAGIPSLMDGSYINSKYKNNDINGIASLLKQYNYNSAFFHGGINGIYGFDFFTKKAGFDKYIGKNEFNNDEYFDGAWGIYDDKFFNFTATQLKTLKQPFVASLFSLSSHDPFKLPSYYKNNLNDSKHSPFTLSVRYTDNSLKKFFEKVKHESWFKNTLFVITANHSPAIGLHSECYNSPIGIYKIPLIFYKYDSKLSSFNLNFVQQIDIIPSVIDYLNLPIKLQCLGKSGFTEYKNRYIYQYNNNSFQVFDSIAYL